MIDTRLLYYLTVIYECKTLSLAADKLHLSQQALGKSMRRLEEELHVSLFNRSKNHIELNEYGLMCVDYAKKILEQLTEMEKIIQLKEKQSRTISIGSLAPRPLYNIFRIINEEFNDIHFESEIIVSKQKLIDGLYNEDYQLIILDEKIDNPDIVCKLWGSEQLYFSLPNQHHLKNKDNLLFQDIDGETMILYKNIGFWKKKVETLMPNTYFIVEDNRDNFHKLLQRSDFVCFTTDLAIEEEGNNNRIIKEITDNEALVSFYVYCLNKNKHKFKMLFR